MKDLGLSCAHFAGGNGDLSQGVLGAFLPELVHVAGGGKGVGVGLNDEAVGVLVLGDGHVGVVARVGPRAATSFAVDYQGNVDEAGADGGQGVLHVDDEGRAADVGAVGVPGGDAQILGHVIGRGACDEEPVDVGQGESGIIKGVECGLRA